MKEAFLGIDVGTFETKGVVVSSNGEILATARRAHTMIVPEPGWAEHDAELDWWAEFASISRELVAACGLPADRIRGVGASGIGPCMLPVDRDGRALCNAILYGVDTRAHREIAELTQRIGEETLLRRTGNALTSQSVGPKILWLRHNRPELFAAADGFVNSSTFLVERLTGRRVIDHYSAASFQPLYDIARQDWADDLIEGITERARLPELVWSTEIAGTVTDEAGAQTGLAPGTPVIAGTIDAAAEAVSVGVARPGDTMMMYGSTVFMIQVTNGTGDDPRLWAAPWLFPGRHALMSGLATSGTLTHWFRERFARELPREDAMRLLAAEALESPPGAKGLIVLPYFSGERTPLHDPHARGMIFGLDLTHERSDMFRAVLEGISYGVRHVIETYAEAGYPIAELSAVGGGTQNAVWAQAVSDVGACSQVIRRRTIGASLGSAFLAALGTGHVREDDIETWNPVERRIEPRAELGPLYDRGFRTYRQLYERTRDLNNWRDDL